MTELDSTSLEKDEAVHTFKKSSGLDIPQPSSLTPSVTVSTSITDTTASTYSTYSNSEQMQLRDLT